MSMDAKTYLMRIRDINEIIIGVIEEIEYHKSIALKITQNVNTVKINGQTHCSEKVQSSGNKDRMANAVCEYTDLESELEVEKDGLIAEKQEIISTIKMLPAREYKLLRLTYIGKVENGNIIYMTLKQASYEMNISRRTASNVHKSALSNIQRMLDHETTRAKEC